jgi:hypothetical protein
VPQLLELSWILSLSLVRRHLARRRTPSLEPTVPLTATRIDETRLSGLQDRTIWFALFRAGAFNSYSFRVRTHFGDSAGESTTSSTSSMKGVNSGTNGSELDKNNILKPTFDTLTEVGRKAFEAYRTDFK